MRNEKGFTLIELLLYISILSIILLVTSGFLYTILQSRVKNQTIAEVDQQGTQIMQMITQTIRNSPTINTPTTGNSGSSLSLTTTVSANNPTIFDVSSGVFRIKEGTGADIPLTNSRVAISGLTFQNLANSIRVQFTISSINSSNRNEYSYTQTFYGSADVRP